MLVGRQQATHLRLSFGLLDAESIREGVRRLAAVVRAHRRELPALGSLPVN
jgi:DNA-binding transcriptional MocR family regulator